jgi:cytochrome c oxidase subunit 2
VPKDHLRVQVLAQQFTWNFQYPDYGNLASTTLRLPVDRTVELQMTSRDVIHSFFVPEFRQKEDILPGEARNLVITPTKTGRYVIQCAELCGLGHAAMLGRVVVMTQAAFDTWARHGSEAAGGGGANPGKTVFDNQGCGSCHTYTPARSTGKIGPDLDKLPEFAKQAKRPLVEFTRDSIVNPSGYIQPGYPNVMPATFSSLPEEQLNALVAFLTPNAKS